MIFLEIRDTMTLGRMYILEGAIIGCICIDGNRFASLS